MKIHTFVLLLLCLNISLALFGECWPGFAKFQLFLLFLPPFPFKGIGGGNGGGSGGFVGGFN